ncbi:hypothetical protein MUK42_02999 [Musa troglodytarum]|uniref:Uncharacterized protein n=2 Tax=Musa troglodytarum TaxID=320322 RepID=A0A9E7EU27_9LILI|nr:hypothetical protein MUK42_02999 [Musa troglodytarum]
MMREKKLRMLKHAMWLVVFSFDLGDRLFIVTFSIAKITKRLLPHVEAM